MRRSIIIFVLVFAALLNACEGLVVAAVVVETISVGTAVAEIFDDQSFPDSEQLATAGETVELKSDVHGTDDSVNLVYEWNQTAGAAVAFVVLKDGSARFVAPAVKSVSKLMFRVRVGGDDGSVHENLFSIIVLPTDVSN